MDNIQDIGVLIIGAGPAGSVCGSLLLQAGIDCLIVDHATFPRDKVCGGGLTVKAWRLLDHLLPGIQYDYRPINHLRIQFEDDPVMEFYSEYEIRMTRRKDFDYTLVQYYQHHGGKLMKDAFAHFEQQPDQRILVTMKSGLQISCHYLVAADGAHSLVRRQLVGDPKVNALFLEQFDEGEKNDDIFVHFSKNYAPGCFYKFSSIGRDIYGFTSEDTNDDFQRHTEKFHKALNHFKVPAGRLRGAHIPLDTVQPTDEHIILIGDAGGFANKLTGEGLYDAFKTAYHANQAIVEQKPFSETNHEVFVKMERQKEVYKYFFSNFGFKLIRWGMHYPRIIKWLFDAKMKRETWIR